MNTCTCEMPFHPANLRCPECVRVLTEPGYAERKRQGAETTNGRKASDCRTHCGCRIGVESCRRCQGAETTASEQAPAHRPHVTQTFATPYCDDYEQRAPHSDGHGEPVDEQRRRLPDTPEARVGLTCRVHGCDDLTDDSGAYCAWHGPEDLADALAEIRFRITPQGFNALTNGDA